MSDETNGFSQCVVALAGDEGVHVKVSHWLKWVNPADAVRILDAVIAKLQKVRDDVVADIESDAKPAPVLWLHKETDA